MENCIFFLVCIIVVSVWGCCLVSCETDKAEEEPSHDDNRQRTMSAGDAANLQDDELTGKLRGKTAETTDVEIQLHNNKDTDNSANPEEDVENRAADTQEDKTGEIEKTGVGEAVFAPAEIGGKLDVPVLRKMQASDYHLRLSPVTFEAVHDSPSRSRASYSHRHGTNKKADAVPKDIFGVSLTEGQAIPKVDILSPLIEALVSGVGVENLYTSHKKKAPSSQKDDRRETYVHSHTDSHMQPSTHFYGQWNEHVESLQSNPNREDRKEKEVEGLRPPRPCFECDVDYLGNDVLKIETGVRSMKECQKLCQDSTLCDFFTHVGTWHGCYLKHSRLGRIAAPGTNLISGLKYCNSSGKITCNGVNIKWTPEITVQI